MEDFQYEIDEPSRTYNEISNTLYAIATNKTGLDKQHLQLLEDIIDNGRGEGFIANKHLTGYDNPAAEASKRIGWANVLSHQPDTFDKLNDMNIGLLHGTSSSALPSILKNGMQSLYDADKNNIEITTGEKSSREVGPNARKRGFVSFTDNPDVATDYALLSSKRDDKAHSFPVIVGVTSDILKRQKNFVPTGSNLPEVGIAGSVPKEEIKVVCVPEDKVDFTQKLVGEGIKVLSFSFYREFYNTFDNNPEFYPDAAKRVLEGENAKKVNKRFGWEDVRKLVGRLYCDRVARLCNSIKGLFNDMERRQIDERGAEDRDQ